MIARESLTTKSVKMNVTTKMMCNSTTRIMRVSTTQGTSYVSLNQSKHFSLQKLHITYIGGMHRTNGLRETMAHGSSGDKNTRFDSSAAAQITESSNLPTT